MAPRLTRRVPKSAAASASMSQLSQNDGHDHETESSNHHKRFEERVAECYSPVASRRERRPTAPPMVMGREEKGKPKRGTKDQRVLQPRREHVRVVSGAGLV
jgi:hypothetical protein